MKYYCSVSFGSTLVMGCSPASACPIVNNVFSENNANKYCCGIDFCNFPSIVATNKQPVTKIQTTANIPAVVTTTTLKATLTCKFGSSGGPVSSIVCPSELYYCGVS